jgi:single-strand DNA-binding protein
MGNLAADPDLIETNSGKKVANFAIATNLKWKDNEGTEKRSTDFHRIIAWNKLGEICGEYLKKGSGVYLEGKLRNRSYETKEGEKKYLTEIVADDINILTWKKSRDGQPDVDVKSLKSDEKDVEEDV